MPMLIRNTNLPFSLVMRRVVAVPAALGLAASGIIYVGSFFGVTMETLRYGVLVLHGGVFPLALAMYAVEHFSSKQRLSWALFENGKPIWVMRGIKLLFAFFIFHFLLFLIQSRAASPDIVNGQYVLNYHGDIVRVLTEAEYLRLKGAELRLFATGWIGFYFTLAAYWWFPKQRALVI